MYVEGVVLQDFRAIAASQVPFVHPGSADATGLRLPNGSDDEVHVYASGNLAVLVVVEHQHGEVGGYPAQDWSLRATLVFRRENAVWHLVHRHADPLAHPIAFDQLAELARG
jgi:hypothetical protein